VGTSGARGVEIREAMIEWTTRLKNVVAGNQGRFLLARFVEAAGIVGTVGRALDHTARAQAFVVVDTSSGAVDP
jgi:TPP-dependent pyruvate/acetoin dehydrogenase alpha subunit